MKYILNETPLKTTNNFKINNIEVELDIPDTFNSTNEISDYDKTKIEILKENTKLTSKIGLELDNSNKMIINVKDNVEILEPLIIDYNIDKSNSNEIEINIGENSKIDFIIRYKSSSKIFNYIKQVTNLSKNSIASISLINLLNSDSTNLTAIETNLLDNSNLTYNFIDLGGKTRISNYYSKLNGIKAINHFNNIYLGVDNDLIDMNYDMECISEKVEANINSEGCLDNDAKKSFKGTINFISGCKKAKGDELENCILLSDKAKSKSLPMLLCTEEDVEGSHGVSTGKIDNNKLFYLTSKGLDESKAKKLIIYGNYNKIVNNINNQNIKDEIIEYINNKLK